MSSSIYQEYISQSDEICYRCEKEVPKGSKCFIAEDEVFCLDCVEKLEAEAESASEE